MTGNNSESSMQRIYVGGLTATVSEADVKGRFQPFGDVIACELAKSKVGDPSLCRGFAYVNFIPKDQAALSRVFSLYNGCKWRGQTLRVELAKPDFQVKLRQEWLEDQELEQQAIFNSHNTDVKVVGIPATADSNEDESEASTIRLAIPGPKRKSIVVDLTSKAKSYRCWFPLQKEKRLADLDWEPLPPSKRIAMQAAAAAAATEVCHADVNRQQQQQQQTEATSQLHRGAAVAFKYPQQQQQPLSKGKQQLEQEHFSQLKLLKRIAHREQQQQQQYDGSRPSAAVFAGPTALKEAAQLQGGLTQQHIRQQHTAAALPGVVMFSDDEEDVAPAGAPTGADLLQQLSRFDDSDVEGDDLLAGLPSMSPLGLPAGQGCWVQTSPKQQAASQPRLVNGQLSKHEQQQQQHQEEEEEDKKQHQLHIDQVQQLPPHHATEDAALEEGSSSTSSDEPSLAGGDQQWEPSSSEDPAAQGRQAEWEETPAAQPPAAALKATKEQQQPQQREVALEQQQVPNLSHSRSSLQQQQQHNRQHNRQQHSQGLEGLPRQMPQARLPAASFAVVEFLEGEQPVAVHTAELDRFGDDSEEVLHDVDSDDDSEVGRLLAARGAGQQAGEEPGNRHKQPGDMLLCPVVAATAAGSGQKATTAKRQRNQQQAAAARSKRG